MLRPAVFFSKQRAWNWMSAILAFSMRVGPAAALAAARGSGRGDSRVLGAGQAALHWAWGTALHACSTTDRLDMQDQAGRPS